MKKLFGILTMATIFASCDFISTINPFNNNSDESKIICPVVASDQLPSTVLTAFNEKYPGAEVLSWFNTDGTGYCAIINYNGSELKVVYDNNGNFISEEIDSEVDNDNIEQEDNNDDGEDDDDDDSGCECDLVESD